MYIFKRARILPKALYINQSFVEKECCGASHSRLVVSAEIGGLTKNQIIFGKSLPHKLYLRF